jgi:hypothetical protein
VKLWPWAYPRPHSEGQVNVQVKCDVRKSSDIKTTLMWRRLTSEGWTSLLTILLQNWTVLLRVFYQLFLLLMAWSCLFLEYCSTSNSLVTPPCCHANIGLAFLYIRVSQTFWTRTPLYLKNNHRSSHPCSSKYVVSGWLISKIKNYISELILDSYEYGTIHCRTCMQLKYVLLSLWLQESDIGIIRND